MSSDGVVWKESQSYSEGGSPDIHRGYINRGQGLENAFWWDIGDNRPEEVSWDDLDESLDPSELEAGEIDTLKTTAKAGSDAMQATWEVRYEVGVWKKEGESVDRYFVTSPQLKSVREEARDFYDGTSGCRPDSDAFSIGEFPRGPIP